MRAFDLALASTALFAKSALGLSLYSSTSARMPGEDLDSGCCRVYKDRFFEGDSKDICDGDSTSLGREFDDNIESWECGPDAEI